MDIGATSFPDYLPIILNDISSSCFVAIDFELSGLAFPPSAPQTKPQTMQERYTEARVAAERYQILQVGLTVCHENLRTGMDTSHFKAYG
jgi:poly(A)-specific ribonuclease